MKTIAKQSGFTLTELMIAVAVSVIGLAAAFSAAITMQRCFVAGEEFASDKLEQSRLSDYLALDLRRALSVQGPSGNTLLTVTIPDYFDDAGNPITPTVFKAPDKTYVTKYGATPLTVVYEKDGDRITRAVDGETPVVIAEGVADFECVIDQFASGDYVDTRVSFLPGFQRSGTVSSSTRTATTIYNTIRLRNRL